MNEFYNYLFVVVLAFCFLPVFVLEAENNNLIAYVAVTYNSYVSVSSKRPIATFTLKSSLATPHTKATPFTLASCTP